MSPHPRQANLSSLWGASSSVNATRDAARPDGSKRKSDAVNRISSSSLKKRRIESDSESDIENGNARRSIPSASQSSQPADPPSPSAPLSDALPAEEDEGEDELSETEAAAASNVQDVSAYTKQVDIGNLWKPNEPVPYAALTNTFSLIEATTKRLEKTSLLTSFFLLLIKRSKPGDHESLLQAVYLCINRLAPDYAGIELGIGESLLIKAICEASGRNAAKVKADLKKEGDLGLVAMNSKASQRTIGKPKPLTLPFVFQQLKEIASSTGHASQNKKVAIINRLLSGCQAKEYCEAKYVIRSLEGKLRIGNAEKSVLVALAHAVVLAEREKSPKKISSEKLTQLLEEGAQIVKSVFSELPSYDLIIPSLLGVGIHGLRSKCFLTPGIPLKPMLAKPTKAIGEVLDRFENKQFTCEYKYDGERAQIHKLSNGEIHIFSRNSEDMGKKYPDIIEQLPRCIKETAISFVLDAEVVAIDRKTNKLMPFQELSKRKRKDVTTGDIQVPVCLFGFDLLFFNEEPILRKTFQERREILRNHFQTVEGEFQFAKSSDGETTDQIQLFLEESVKDGCEGLMVKMLTSEASYYEPSKRSVNWLKLKKDYLSGIGDSLDLAVVGAYYGKGKRTNVYGAFLLACYDADAESFQTICKIGTGFSDEVLQSHHQTLKPLESVNPRGDISVGGAKPDIWFQPQIVWEVLTADLSLSPIYTAAQGLIDERGISLRFPRFIRVREDKGADEATGPEQIAEMYARQATVNSKSGKKKKSEEEEDGFW